MTIPHAPDTRAALLQHTTTVVCAFVSHNAVPLTELPGLISRTYEALEDVSLPQQKIEEPAVLVPAVPVKKSIFDDYIVCLEDGKKFKSLKRHLRTQYNMSPDEYRAKWSLDRDYPMVAPNYARARSELAKTMGLGTRRNKTAQAAVARKVTTARKPAKAAA